jgi:tRNA-splicing ligase RtcB
MVLCRDLCRGYEMLKSGPIKLESEMSVSGKHLVEAGFTPGAWFTVALKSANEVLANGGTHGDAIAAASKHRPEDRVRVPLQTGVSFFKNIRPENEFEEINVRSVVETMTEVMKTPWVKAGAIMPDACPAGPIGTIPVGGIVASAHIHPGMHSADICCSMAISVFDDVDPLSLLNAVNDVTHFGPGGRGNIRPAVVQPFPILMQNPFLHDAEVLSASHFATQGDGNHFAYVGTMKSTGQTALVTHHGSRGPGAALYKAGMRAADRYRLLNSPETLKQNAWIPSDTKDGDDYWAALQMVRTWTRESHFAIHDLAKSLLPGSKVTDRFWNEHNFVFRKSDGLFYHAKGATPAFGGWADDASDLTIIPLNMAEPILIVRGSNADNGLGFSPHGAGRNFSRTQHKRQMGGRTDEDIFAEETAGIDARFFMGITDISELPSAYKNAASVRRQITEYGLAEVVDEVMPFGCIMAGDWEKNAPWKKKRAPIPDEA